MDAEQGRSRPVIWLGALALLCAAILAWGLISSPTDMPSNLGYAAGYAGAAGVTGGLIFTRILGSFWRGKGVIAGLTIAASAFAAILIMTERTRAGVLEVMGFIRNDMIGALSAADPTKPLPNIATQNNQSGDLGVMRGFLTRMYNHQAETQREYLSRLNGIRWETMLDAARIDRDVTFSETMGMVENARTIVAAFRERDIAYVTSLNSQIETLDFSSDSVRQGARAGIERGLARSRPVLDDMWRLESEVVDRIEDLAVFLHERRGNWSYNNEQVLFESDEDVADYNAAFSAIEQVIGEQERIKASQLATASEMIDSFERRLGKP